MKKSKLLSMILPMPILGASIAPMTMTMASCSNSQDIQFSCSELTQTADASGVAYFVIKTSKAVDNSSATVSISNAKLLSTSPVSFDASNTANVKISIKDFDKTKNYNESFSLTFTFKVSGVEKTAKVDNLVIKFASTPAPAPTSIKINSPTDPVLVGASFDFKVQSSIPADADKSVVWSSSDETIATIDKSSGKANFIKKGNVTITATSSLAPSVTASYSTTVILAPTSFSILGVSEIPLNTTIAYSIDAVKPTDADRSVVWSVESSGGTASITQKGELTGLTVGDVIVKATSKYNSSVFATKTVSVVDLAPTAIVINGASEVESGLTCQYSITTTPASASKEVNWSILSPDLGCTISKDGLLTASTQAGTIKIQATSKKDSSVSTTKNVEIKHVVHSVSVVGEESIGPSTVQKYNVTVDASSGCSKDVTWEIQDYSGSGTVSIDANGNVTTTGAEIGKTFTVVATSAFDSSKSGSKKVTIESQITATIDASSATGATLDQHSSLIIKSNSPVSMYCYFSSPGKTIDDYKITASGDCEIITETGLVLEDAFMFWINLTQEQAAAANQAGSFTITVKDKA